MTIQRKAPKKATKKKVTKRRPNPIDFETQLENFIDYKQKVQIQYRYGSFYGLLTHSVTAYSIDIKDRSVFFVFDVPDIKDIKPKSKITENPIIVLK